MWDKWASLDGVAPTNDSVCPAGHPMTPSNTRVQVLHRCRECERVQRRTRYAAGNAARYAAALATGRLRSALGAEEERNL